MPVHLYFTYHSQGSKPCLMKWLSLKCKRTRVLHFWFPVFRPPSPNLPKENCKSHQRCGCLAGSPHKSTGYCRISPKHFHFPEMLIAKDLEHAQPYQLEAIKQPQEREKREIWYIQKMMHSKIPSCNMPSGKNTRRVTNQRNNVGKRTGHFACQFSVFYNSIVWTSKINNFFKQTQSQERIRWNCGVAHTTYSSNLTSGQCMLHCEIFKEKNCFGRIKGVESCEMVQKSAGMGRHRT